MISPYALDFSLMLLGAKKKTEANGEIYLSNGAKRG
jgi:hypothetical protein